MELQAPIANTTTTVELEFVEAANRYEESTKIRRFYDAEKPERLSPTHLAQYMIQKEIADRYGKREIQKFLEDRELKRIEELFSNPEFIEAADRYEASTRIRRFYGFERPESFYPAERVQYDLQKEIAGRYGECEIKKFLEDRALKRKMEATAERIRHLEEVEDPPKYRMGPRMAIEIYRESKQRIHDIGEDLDDCVGMKIHSDPYMLQYDYHKRRHARLVAIYGYKLFREVQEGGDPDHLYQEFVQKCGGNEASLRSGSLTESEVEARYIFIEHDLKSLPQFKADVDTYTRQLPSNQTLYQGFLDKAVLKYNAASAMWDEISTQYGRDLFADLWTYYG